MSRRKRSDGTPERSSRRGTPERPSRRKHATKHDDEDPDIKIFPLNGIDPTYKLNHSRLPDLSANIKVVFPTEEYMGAYLSHGQTKTVFVLKSNSARHTGKFEGFVLKIRRQGLDMEPQVMKKANGITPRVFYECMGRDGNAQYHCWVAERCIPLHELAKLENICKKERCVLAACRCIATAAEQHHLCLSDCHYFNLGVRISTDAGEHKVVIIDVGSRGIAPTAVIKSEVNECMRKLWKWTEEELGTSPAKTQKIWWSAHNLADAVNKLDRAWQEDPYLTEQSRMPTANIDEIIVGNFSKKFREFVETPQGQLLKLIGRSSVEWMGSAWTEDLSEICMRVADETHTTFTSAEVKALAEMHCRICTKTVQSHHVDRTTEEIDDIIAFWWKLQQRRRNLLNWTDRYDTPDTVLNDTEILRVKKDWQYYEMWYELTPYQRRHGHRPSIYNAVLHQRSGWATVANAIIKYHMPQLSYLRNSDGLPKRNDIIERFCCDLIGWMKKFARAAVVYWNTEEYHKARRSSELPSTPSRSSFLTSVPEDDEDTERQGELAARVLNLVRRMP